MSKKSQEGGQQNKIVQFEHEVLEFWEKEKCFAKSVAQRPADKQYTFYDGPPFATGLPHYGHILSSTIKDVVPRFWTMKGFRVARRWGWDCHGLPIENIAEQELKISGKKEIEKIGVEKFNEFCRSKVFGYATEWGKMVRRMGRWVDFTNSYKTLDNTYIESVWWGIKQVYEKGFLYEGRKVLLYCPRCETPISNFEVAMDNSYREVTDPAVFVKFKVRGRGNVAQNLYLLAWTTTPWTLPGNVALAAGAEIEYVQIRLKEVKGEEYILAKERLGILDDKDYEMVKTWRGKELIGWEYEPLFEISGLSELGKRSHYVTTADFVTTQEGTGIVHTAVIYGEDDYNLGIKLDLPMWPTLNERGEFKNSVPKFAGLYFKKANPAIIKDLEQRGLLFKEEQYQHAYPHCYRCETDLYYNAIPAWFINVQKIKQRLIALNERINWVPDNIKHGRFLKGLESAPDWNISRNRYWASPLPIWKCSCGQLEVIGSLQELRQKAIDPKLLPEGADLHKHVVDQVKIRCAKCGQEVARIPEVIDCWVESASMPFAAQHYPFENKQWFKENFPAQFVAEYVAQTRAWFYVMLVMSAILFDRVPFENVVVTGTIMASDGNKMSKSKKNYPDPWVLIEKYGVDALRFYLMSTPVMNGENVNFSEEAVDEIYKKLLLTLYNVHTFWQTFSSRQDQNYVPKFNNVLDRWAMAKIHGLVTEVSQAMETYNVVHASRQIIDFVQELSKWYVRRSRERIKGDNEASRQEALATLELALLTVVKVAAPIIPFSTEKIYQLMRRPADPISVHLCDWPQARKEFFDEKILEQMRVVRAVIEQALALRAEAGIKVRQPLASVTVAIGAGEQELGEEFGTEWQQIIKDELNVKEVKFGRELALDTKLTDELRREGLLRELIRQINALRKKAGLTINDLIELKIHTTNAELREAITNGQSVLQKSVLAKSVTLVDAPQEKELVINSQKLTLSFAF